MRWQKLIYSILQHINCKKDEKKRENDIDVSKNSLVLHAISIQQN